MGMAGEGEVPDITGVTAVPIEATWWRHIPAEADAFHKPRSPHVNRWQRGHVVDAFYLSDSPDTAYAEWYRTLARLRTPVLEAVPFDLVGFQVSLRHVADLSDPARLGRVGLPAPRPGTSGWSAFQAVGEGLRKAGFDGVLAPTDARPGYLLLCVFRPGEGVPGVLPLGPAIRVTEPPLVPIGLAT